MSDEPEPLTKDEIAGWLSAPTGTHFEKRLIATIRAIEARARLIPQDVYATTASLVARAEAAEARVRRLRGHIRFIGGERLTDPAKPGDLEEPKR